MFESFNGKFSSSLKFRGVQSKSSIRLVIINNNNTSIKISIAIAMKMVFIPF